MTGGCYPTACRYLFHFTVCQLFGKCYLIILSFVFLHFRVNLLHDMLNRKLVNLQIDIKTPCILTHELGFYSVGVYLFANGTNIAVFVILIICHCLGFSSLSAKRLITFITIGFILFIELKKLLSHGLIKLLSNLVVHLIHFLNIHLWKCLLRFSLSSFYFIFY